MEKTGTRYLSPRKPMERSAVVRGTLGLLLLLGPGCPRQVGRYATAAGSMESPASADAILSQLRRQIAYPSHAAFRLKYQAQYESETRQSFQLRVLGRNSLLWMSAGFMGFEGFRLLWRQDSLFIVNRLLREAYLGSVDSLRALFPPVGAADFMALLLGYWPPSLDQATWEWQAETHILQGRLSTYEVQALLSDALQIQGWILGTGANAIHLEYDYAATSPKLPYPKVTFRFPDESRLTLTPKEAESNPTDLQMPFAIPEGYSVKPLREFGLR